MADEPEEPWADVSTPSLRSPQAAAFIQRALGAIKTNHPKMSHDLALRHAMDAWHAVHYGFMHPEHAHRTALHHAAKTMEGIT